MSKPYQITQIEQFQALTSPIRGEILDIVALMGPVSIAKIAFFMGRPIDSLYYHVKLLSKVGLLIPDKKQKSTRQMEATFDLPGRPMSLKYDPSQHEHVENVKKSVSAMLRATERNVHNAFENNLIHVRETDRNMEHSLTLGWYNEEEIYEIREQIAEIINRFRSTATNRKAGRGLYAMTSILVPIKVKGKA